MNIIEAWNKAKNGQKIKRPSHERNAWVCKGEENLKYYLDLLVEDALLADDWEVVKEKKTASFVTCSEGNVCFYDKNRLQVDEVEVPKYAKVVITWEE